VPIFVLTHQVPETVAKCENDQLRFTFVTDGIEHAIAQARAAAGEKDVTVIGGAQTVQQCLHAELVDELQIDLVPVLLGGGLRLFDQPASKPVELERKSALTLALGKARGMFYASASGASIPHNCARSDDAPNPLRGF
jgi:dihydrofolate reductase